MHDYNKLELQTLIDLLAKHTSKYTRLMACGIFSGEDFAQCKHTLAEILDAVKAKKIDDEKQVKKFFPDFTNKKNLSEAESQEPTA
jgi:hypothetical protein